MMPPPSYVPPSDVPHREPYWVETMEIEQEFALDFWPGTDERAECQQRWRHAYFAAIRLGQIEPYRWTEGGRP